MSIECEALNFINSLQKLYLEQRDIETVLKAIDEKTSWIGTGEQEICKNFTDAAQALLNDRKAYTEGFTVTDSWYETEILPQDACIVYGEFRAHVNDDTIGLAELHHRITAVCAKKNGKMKLLHLHMSKPDDDQETGEVFVKKRTKADNQELRRIVELTGKNLRERNQDLEALAENIPGGVHQCLNDSEFTLLSMSNGFWNMFGYTQEEIAVRFDNKYMNMIHPADHEYVRKAIKEQLAKGTTVELEYRVICKNKEILWILDRGNLAITAEGRQTFYCMLLDITQRKKEQEELRLSLERHEVIMDQATDVIFEWDIEKDTMTYSSNWGKKFGYHPIETHISRRIPESNDVYYEDVEEFIKIMKDTLAGIPYSEIEFRIRNETTGYYTWCRIRSTTQFDIDKKPIKALGVIVDIDEEKKQKQRLIDQAQKDGLTGLYNKATTKAKTEKIIGHSKCGICHALLIIDVDNFKNVNDRFGHLYGDAVLTAMADGLKKLFRKSDVIGRIGGDEFLVFMPDITRQDTVAVKALEILKIFREMPGNTGVNLSCSTGIALYPQDAKEYTSLCQCADSALYHVKNSGKGGYAFYQENMRDSVSCLIPRTAINEKIDSEENIQIDQELVQYTFRMLYNAVDLDTAINQILQMVGQAYDVSRVYIFESSEDGLTCNNTYEWCGKNVCSEMKNLQNISYQEDLGGYISNFNDNGVFYCTDIKSLHPDLYAILAPQKIVSLLQCAISDDGYFSGYVGFDECRTNRYWTKEQISSLTLIANVLSTFLLKQRLKEQLARLRTSNHESKLQE